MLNNIRIEKINLAPIWATKFFLEVSALRNVRIVPSCNLVQYQAKLMMQPSENLKNPKFGPNLGAQIFFRGFHLYWWLDNIPNYYPIQFFGKRMN